MPSLELYAVDYENDLLHYRLLGASTVSEAWLHATLCCGFSPQGTAVRVYEGRLPVLEATPTVTQFGLWHCHYEEET